MPDPTPVQTAADHVAPEPAVTMHHKSDHPKANVVRFDVAPADAANACMGSVWVNRDLIAAMDNPASIRVFVERA